MTIPQTSHLHINNLPSEIIHKIQGELEKVRGIAGIKSVFNLATTCRTMYSHACEFNRLQSIGFRYTTFTKMPFYIALAIANKKRPDLLTKATVERIEDDLDQGIITRNSPDFQRLLSSANQDLKTAATQHWIKEINQREYIFVDFNKTIAETNNSNNQIKKAATDKLISWADNNEITGLEPELFTQLHQDNALGRALQSAFARHLETVTPATPLRNLDRNLIHSPLEHIREPYIATICNLLKQNVYSFDHFRIQRLHQNGPAAITDAIEYAAVTMIQAKRFESIPYFNQESMISSNNAIIRNYAFNHLVALVNRGLEPAEKLNSNVLISHSDNNIREKASEELAKSIRGDRLKAKTKTEILTLINHPSEAVRSAIADQYINKFCHTFEEKKELLNNHQRELRLAAMNDTLNSIDMHSEIFKSTPLSHKDELLSVYCSKLRYGNLDTIIPKLLNKNELEFSIQKALEDRLTFQLKMGIPSARLESKDNELAQKILSNAKSRAINSISNRINSTLRYVKAERRGTHVEPNLNIMTFSQALKLTQNKLIGKQERENLKEIILTLLPSNYNSINNYNKSLLLGLNSPIIKNILLNKIILKIKNGSYDNTIKESISGSSRPSYFSTDDINEELRTFINHNMNGPNFKDTALFEVGNEKLMQALAERYKIALDQKAHQLNLRKDIHQNQLHVNQYDLPVFFTKPNKNTPTEILKLKNVSLYEILKNKPELTKRVCLEQSLYENTPEKLKDLINTAVLNKIDLALSGKSHNKINKIVESDGFWKNTNNDIKSNHDVLLKNYLKRARFHRSRYKGYKTIIENAPQDLVQKYKFDKNLSKAEKHDERLEKIEKYVENKPIAIKLAFGLVLASALGASELKHKLRD
ncbi:MAG: hypothetical protein VX185_12960 [Pseudomonadota bacterium]|nr:hypothetical protein [Pseudomonadota bacterium]